MSGVDCCITTMDRPWALERLLLSIAAHHPEATVHVADQSESDDSDGRRQLTERAREAGLRRPPVVHRLPFDCGVSAARNHLADSTPGEYKLFLDDDFVFTDRTDIDAMARLLDTHPRAAVVGGSVSRNGRIRNVGTMLHKHDESLVQVVAANPFGERDGLRFRRTDCVPMFALMRGELFAELRWDEALKTAAEHFDFFLRLRQTPHLVLHAPDVTIDHPPTDVPADYARLRWRGELLAQMLTKHSLRRLKTVDGTITELCDDGELIRYCELEREAPGPAITRS